MTAHALLSASGAHRWLACPGSVHLERNFPSSTSIYAEEGTLAHAICELAVRQWLNPDIIIGPEFEALKKHELYQPEMLACAETYLNYIKSIAYIYKNMPHIALERSVNFSDYVPDGFGTADCIIIGDHDLHIVDYKHGKGVEVSAEHNPQMMLYALGALNAYDVLYGINTVYLTIVQPRIDNISEWSLTAEELYSWAVNVVKPTAEKAYKGCEEYSPGEHCRFCKAKAQCKARAEQMMELYPVAEDWQEHPKTLKAAGLYSKEDLAKYIKAGALIKAWYEDISEHALQLCLNGEAVPGYKAVEGRSSREFTDQDAAFKALLTAGIDKALLYNYVPLTLAQAEKVVTKKRFGEIVGQYITKKPGKPTLVPETDKRAAISNKVTAAEIFKKMED